MANRSDREPGHPAECPGHHSPQSRVGPSSRIPSGPAVTRTTASTGRTQDCTRPTRQKLNSPLAMREPSTQDGLETTPSRRFAPDPTQSSEFPVGMLGSGHETNHLRTSESQTGQGLGNKASQNSKSGKSISRLCHGGACQRIRLKGQSGVLLRVLHPIHRLSFTGLAGTAYKERAYAHEALASS